MKKFHLLIFAVATTLTLQATSQADPTSILRARAGLSTAAGLLAVEGGPFADRFTLSLGWLPSIQIDELTRSLMPNASTGTRPVAVMTRRLGCGMWTPDDFSPS